MQSRWQCRLWIASAAFAVLAMSGILGCGGGGIPMADVQGEVKYDGQPIEKGTITFKPADGKGPSVGGEINQGRFSLRVPPGPKRVEVSAVKVVGKTEPTLEAPTGTDIIKEQIPQDYNLKSTLTEEVKMPETTINLDLKPVAAANKR
jgi:hypothetical protein